jgi:hypothetical protein
MSIHDKIEQLAREAGIDPAKTPTFWSWSLFQLAEAIQHRREVAPRIAAVIAKPVAPAGEALCCGQAWALYREDRGGLLKGTCGACGQVLGFAP